MTGPESRFQDNGTLALLAELGLLPPDSCFSSTRRPELQKLAAALPGSAVEQWLLELWSGWRRVAPPRQREHAAQTAAWLQGVADTGGCLTVGLADDAGQRLRELCGPRILFWPGGMPAQPLTALTTSRMGRTAAGRCEFVTRLKHVMHRIAEAGHRIVAVDGTAGCDLVVRAAQRDGVPLLRVGSSSGGRSARWLSQLTQAAVVPRPGECLLWISPSRPAAPPVARGAESTSGHRDCNGNLPLRDRIVFALADVLWCLSVRPGGNQHRLLQWRLRRARAASACVRLVLAADEAASESADECLRLGAVAWRLLASGDAVAGDSASGDPVGEDLAAGDGAGSSPAVSGRCEHTIARGNTAAREHAEPVRNAVSSASLELHENSESHENAGARGIALAGNCDAPHRLREELSHDGEWLIHWTRASTGPHGGQAATAWLDQQLDAPFDAMPDPLSTLRRILCDGVLRASSDSLRGSRPMVCFSAVPLLELQSRRRFRTHRARWDFEPYGLCVRRRRLTVLGARPVIYGDDAVWRALPEPERPWFQRRFSGRGQTRIDWSREAEWRIAGDVDLKQFSGSDLVVFCRVPDEIGDLTLHGHWPVVALASLFSGGSATG